MKAEIVIHRKPPDNPENVLTRMVFKCNSVREAEQWSKWLYPNSDIIISKEYLEPKQLNLF